MIIVNRSTSKEAVIDRINDAFDKACQLFKKDEDIVDALEQLRRYGLNMAGWVDEYDIIDGLHANGFRSLLTKGIELVEFTIQEHMRLDTREVRQVLDNYRKAIPYVQRMREETKPSRSLEVSEATWAEFLLEHLNSTDSLSYFYTRIGHFWLSPLDYNFMSLVHETNSKSVCPSLLSKIKSFFDVDHKKRLMAISTMALQPRPERDKFDLIEWLWLTITPWYVNGWGKPEVVTDIEVPRPTKYQILINPDGRSTFIDDTNSSNFRSDQVTCRFIRRSQEVPKVLMINIHGGSYMRRNRYMSDPSLRKWVMEVPNLAAVSVEYSLAPEHKFPVALQESLDVYLFFADPKNSEKIKSLIGFIPEKLIISGDSAGGNLALGVTLALSTIQRDYWRQLMLPASIFLFYPNVTLKPTMKPSLIMNGTPGLINPQSMVQVVRAYLPETGRRSDLNDNLEKRESRNFRTVDVGWWQWLTSREIIPKVDIPEEEIRNLSKDCPLVFDQLVSPLFGDFSGLENVSLFTYACRLDGLIDEALMFSKKWPGPKKVTIFENLFHGFLSAGFKSDAVEAMTLISGHLRSTIVLD